MTIAYLSRSALFILFFALAAVACSSSSKKNGPDSQPDVNSSTDVSLASPLDSAGLDASSESQGEAGSASQLTVAPTSIDLGIVQPGATSPRQAITVTATSDVSDLTVSLLGEDLTLCSSTLTITPVTSDLGSVAVGETGPSVTFTLTSSEDVAQGPLTVTLSSAELVITDDTCSTSVLPSGGTCTINIALRPTSAGGKSATLTVTSPAGAPAVKTLTGTGTVSLDGGGPADSRQAQGEAGNIAIDGSSG